MAAPVRNIAAPIRNMAAPIRNMAAPINEKMTTPINGKMAAPINGKTARSIYDYEFVDDLDLDLSCIEFHYNKFKNAVKIEQCGHTFCEDCFNKMKATAEENFLDFRCPFDQQKIDTTRVSKLDSKKPRSMNLDVKCPNYGAVCNFTGDIYDVWAHEKACGEKKGTLLNRLTLLESSQMIAVKDRQIGSLYLQVVERNKEIQNLKKQINNNNEDNQNRKRKYQKLLSEDLDKHRKEQKKQFKENNKRFEDYQKQSEEYNKQFQDNVKHLNEYMEEMKKRFEDQNKHSLENINRFEDQINQREISTSKL